jgi:hypothetical protein
MGHDKSASELLPKPVERAEEHHGVCASRHRYEDAVSSLDHGMALNCAAHRFEKHKAIVATLRGQCNGVVARDARRYAGLVNRWGVVTSLWLAISVMAAGHPLFVPVDPPVALVQADPGRTTFSLALEPHGWTATLSRSISDACDIVAVVSSLSPFNLRVRALVPSSPFPLRMAVEAGQDHLALFGALHLGPMRIVGERRWGESSGVRVSLHASTPALAVAAGAELGGRVRPLLAASWFPNPVELWGVTLTLAPSQWRVTMGGTW